MPSTAPTIPYKLSSYPQRVHQLLHSQCSSQCTRSATVGALTVQQSVHWNSTVSAFGKHNSKEKHAGLSFFRRGFPRVFPCHPCLKGKKEFCVHAEGK